MVPLAVRRVAVEADQRVELHAAGGLPIGKPPAS